MLSAYFQLIKGKVGCVLYQNISQDKKNKRIFFFFFTLKNITVSKGLHKGRFISAIFH